MSENEKQPTIDWGLIMGIITDTAKEIGVDGLVRGLRGLSHQEPTHRMNTGRTETEDLMNHEERLQKLEHALEALEGDPSTGAVSWEYMAGVEESVRDAERDLEALQGRVENLERDGQDDRILLEEHLEAHEAEHGRGSVSEAEAMAAALTAVIDPDPALSAHVKATADLAEARYHEAAIVAAAVEYVNIAHTQPPGEARGKAFLRLYDAIEDAGLLK